MLSEDEIREYCDNRTLQLARQIAESDHNILTQQCRISEEGLVLSAFVASSNGWKDRYRTSVTIDEDDGYIVDYVCTCPAYREYDGMCKHCTALALSYVAHPQRFIGYNAKRTQSTSPSIASFMERARNTALSESAGIIDLETTLIYGYEYWSAQFKVVGPGGSYVMKNISEFVQSMRENRFVSYGKKLAFTHSPAAFTDSGRAIAHFLDTALALREQATQRIYWRNAPEEIGRSIDLSEAELIALLDALENVSFTVEGTDYGTRSLSHVHIVNADPQIDLELCHTSKNGYVIMRKEPVTFASFGTRMYVWQNDVFYRCSPAFAQCADFLRTVYDSDEKNLFISEKDMPLFCATVLPAIEEVLHVHAPQEVEAYRPIPCQFEFYFDKNDQAITCEPWAVYGKQRFSLYGKGDTTDDESTPTSAPLRDERQEEKAKQLVKRYFSLTVDPALFNNRSKAKTPSRSKQHSKASAIPSFASIQPTFAQADVTPFIPLADDERMGDLLFSGLAQFHAFGTAFTTPAFDRLLFDRKPRVSMGVSIVGNLINLSVSASDLSADELTALLSSYRKHKHFHRLKNGAFLNLADFELAQLDYLVDDLNITSAELAKGAISVPAYRAFYLDDQLDDENKDESFACWIKNFHTPDQNAWEPPASLASTLRPYQIEGFRWLCTLADCDFGGVLADEMGLGKSIQLISFLLAHRGDASTVGPSLIVCPASLVYNWMAEFERFAPQLDVRPVVGTKRERIRVRNEGATCDVLITSYDLLRIDVADFASRDFFCCALDEAQYIKNYTTKTARSVKRINARYRFALTGTPMENRLSELWSIFDFLMPGLLGSYMRFRERYELAVMGGDQDATHRLQALVGPFMLRRCKTEVLRELPDKLESVVYAHLEGEQRRLYDAHEQRLRVTLAEQKKKDYTEKKVEVLAELTKLRQLCCDPHLLFDNYSGGAAKLDTISDLIGSVCDAGEKALVFSQFTSFLSLIAARLDAKEVPYYTITGATPKKKRLQLVNKFNDDTTPVFLVSLKAGGTGLNLTGASVVIHADPWWNAAAQNQATDRAHRIGQTQVVSVHQVIAKGTIEERILTLQEKKSNLAAQIIGASGVSLASLSREDLLDLLGG